MSGITLLGLGPGHPEQLTRQAWSWISTIPVIYLRTRQHPTVAGFPASLQIKSFDEEYEHGENFSEVYARIVDKIISLGQTTEGVTYAVPGHPMVAEATCPAILRQAGELGISVRVIEGLSFLEPTFTALQIDPFPQIALVDALELADALVPSFPSSFPVLIAQIYSRQVAANVKLTLNALYPDEHPVHLIHGAGTPDEVVERLHLYEIDRSPLLNLLTSLYVEPLGADTSLESFQEVVARLRAPDGCPWDREQDHLTLRTNLLEETYEALEALDAQDVQGICEELGDLLMQIVLHAQIASEEGEFTLADVLRGINQKIIRRHPHVFGNVKVAGVDGVVQNWEKIKQAERITNGNERTKGLLDGIPTTLPALAQAQAVQERARRVGLGWGQFTPVISEVREKLVLLESNFETAKRADFLGDLFFTIVRLARMMNTDAESVLREAVARFRKRFGLLEQRTRENNSSLADMSPEEMSSLWDEMDTPG